MTPFGEQPARFSTESLNGHRFLAGFDDLAPPHDDPRWPTRCACGYVFSADDPWQVFQHQIYRRSDTGEEMTVEEAPPGAMWDAWWYEGFGKTPDGKHLCVKLPNGSSWYIDGPATGGGSWTRSGTPPIVTAKPSIFANQGKPNEWHGWLTDGVLHKC